MQLCAHLGCTASLDLPTKLIFSSYPYIFQKHHISILFLKIYYRLHEEIEDFYQWMVPTQHEHYTRLGVVYRVRKAILKRYPACRVDIFGSFRTGLYLPTR